MREMTCVCAWLPCSPTAVRGELPALVHEIVDAPACMPQQAVATERPDQAQITGASYCLEATRLAQLAEDAVDVPLDHAQSGDYLLRNRLVGVPGGQEPQYLQLARGEMLDTGGWWLTWGGREVHRQRCVDPLGAKRSQQHVAIRTSQTSRVSSFARRRASVSMTTLHP